MFKKAMEMGADFVATGHYARLRREIRNKFQTQNPKSKIKLFKAQDKEKTNTAKNFLIIFWDLNTNKNAPKIKRGKNTL